MDDLRSGPEGCSLMLGAKKPRKIQEIPGKSRLFSVIGFVSNKIQPDSLQIHCKSETKAGSKNAQLKPTDTPILLLKRLWERNPTPHRPKEAPKPPRRRKTETKTRPRPQARKSQPPVSSAEASDTFFRGYKAIVGAARQFEGPEEDFRILRSQISFQAV